MIFFEVDKQVVVFFSLSKKICRVKDIDLQQKYFKGKT